MAEPDTSYPTSESRPYVYEPVIKPWHRIFIRSLHALSIVVLVVCMILLYRDSVRTPRNDSAKQFARDAAAAERAAAFVRALGFEPGPAVCRALESGSAWCTARVAGSDKTFSLWCSRRHPVCIENLPRE